MFEVLARQKLLQGDPGLPQQEKELQIAQSRYGSVKATTASPAVVS